MKRFIWIDYAKSIGIYFVVLGHTHLYTPLSNVIYTWLMPVFFFISGYLFSFEKTLHSKLLPGKDSKAC
nr:acyltransferase family protein [Barnesiella viscericola]